MFKKSTPFYFAGLATFRLIRSVPGCCEAEGMGEAHWESARDFSLLPSDSSDSAIASARFTEFILPDSDKIKESHYLSDIAYRNFSKFNHELTDPTKAIRLIHNIPNMCFAHRNTCKAIAKSGKEINGCREFVRKDPAHASTFNFLGNLQPEQKTAIGFLKPIPYQFS
jgi:hypothetical protein